MLLGKAVLSVVLALGSVSSAQAASLDLGSNLRFDQKLMGMIDQANRALNERGKFEGLFDDKTNQFSADRAVGNEVTTTIKFTQTYNGLEVVGGDALVHFTPAGEMLGVTGEPLKAALSTKPTLSATDALRIVSERFQQNIGLSRPAKLKVFEDFNGTPRLVYHMLTRTSPTHNGQEIYLDAHEGIILLEAPRTYHADARQIVYRADTEEARKPGRIERGEDGNSRAPTDVDFSWYDKVIENGTMSGKEDLSAIRAYTNAEKVFDYYLDTFKRRSYDDNNAPLNSVVHIGANWNNAFWSSEYEVMGYGDGDGKTFKDLTFGLDVAAHEMTHAVTSSTANLVYSGEPGALNESYSDFFGKMVDFDSGNWLIGHTIMAEGQTARGIRNMLNPEEFRQPKDTEDSRKIPTDGFCWSGNDYCGVHRNSGIPNRAGALIVEAIGKEKAQRLYYTVLTQYLASRDGFSKARACTETVCGNMFGADSEECKAVSDAFETVKIKADSNQTCNRSLGSGSDDEL